VIDSQPPRWFTVQPALIDRHEFLLAVMKYSADKPALERAIWDTLVCSEADKKLNKRVRRVSNPPYTNRRMSG
jgi:hypothetical protein